jgi:DNA-binding MarR family transcriptional regulator
VPQKAESSVLNYNKIIHERSRLIILTKLASSSGKIMSFSDLKDALNFTAGNLSVHLKQLEEAGYIAIDKKFENNKPLTTVIVTDFGIKSLEEYLNDMEKLIKSLKG